MDITYIKIESLTRLQGIKADKIAVKWYIGISGGGVGGHHPLNGSLYSLSGFFYLGFVAFLLLLLLLIFWSRQQLKKKSSKLLDLQWREIQMRERKLESLVTQKELLLKEVHHRVKNNLQIVASLLSLQSRYLTNVAARQAIRESQQRIHSMSLIHRRAYGADSPSYVDMQNYLHELTGSIREGFDNPSVKIVIDSTPMAMHISYAVPIGLILNESVSNALGHAFPNGTGGTITISLKHEEKDTYVLMIADDGAGLPRGVDGDSKDSLGISLMRGLAGDLGGSFRMDSVTGTRIIIAFSYSKSLQEDHFF